MDSEQGSDRVQGTSTGAQVGRTNRASKTPSSMSTYPTCGLDDISATPWHRFSNCKLKGIRQVKQAACSCPLEFGVD